MGEVTSYYRFHGWRTKGSSWNQGVRRLQKTTRSSHSSSWSCQHSLACGHISLTSSIFTLSSFISVCLAFCLDQISVYFSKKDTVGFFPDSPWKSHPETPIFKAFPKKHLWVPENRGFFGGGIIFQSTSVGLSFLWIQDHTTINLVA